VLHSFVTIYRGAKIGDDFFLHAHAVVREFLPLGDRVILQNGVVIGGDGFGFAKQKDGTWQKMLQAGPAVLEDDVEVQSNSCVDRATIGETRIGRRQNRRPRPRWPWLTRWRQHTALRPGGACWTTKVGSDCIFAGQVGSGGTLPSVTARCSRRRVGYRTTLPVTNITRFALRGAQAMAQECGSAQSNADAQKRLRELEAEIAKLKSL